MKHSRADDTAGSSRSFASAQGPPALLQLDGCRAQKVKKEDKPPPPTRTMDGGVAAAQDCRPEIAAVKVGNC